MRNRIWTRFFAAGMLIAMLAAGGCATVDKDYVAQKKAAGTAGMGTSEYDDYVGTDSEYDDYVGTDSEFDDDYVGTDNEYNGDVRADSEGSGAYDERGVPLDHTGMVPERWQTAPYIGTGWTLVEAEIDGTVYDDVAGKMRLEFYNQYDATFFQEGMEPLELDYSVRGKSLNFDDGGMGSISANIVDCRMEIRFRGTLIMEQTYTVDSRPPRDGGYDKWICYPLEDTEWELIAAETEREGTLSPGEGDGWITFAEDGEVLSLFGWKESIMGYSQTGYDVGIDLPGTGYYCRGACSEEMMTIELHDMDGVHTGTYTFALVK